MDIWKELRGEGVDPALLEEIQHFRAAHPVPPEAEARIPVPQCLYYGTEVWESAAAALLCGTHDYTSFCANRRMKKSAVRTVDAITVERRGEEVRLTFSGDGFLYHMVRILTGTLLEVGLGQRDADTMPAILAAHDRSAAGPTAPARGLILWETRY